MYKILTMIVISLGVLALIGTILVGFIVNKTVKNYENDGDNRIQNQIKRSLDYETSSLKKNVPMLTAIYGFTFLIAIISIIFIITTNV